MSVLGWIFASSLVVFVAASWFACWQLFWAFADDASPSTTRGDADFLEALAPSSEGEAERSQSSDTALAAWRRTGEAPAPDVKEET